MSEELFDTGGEAAQRLRVLKKDGLLRGKAGREGLDLLDLLDRESWTEANRTYAHQFADKVEASAFLVKEMELGMSQGHFDDWKCKKMKSLIQNYDRWGTFTDAQIAFANKMCGDIGRW
jgi:hypothetical protein